MNTKEKWMKDKRISEHTQRALTEEERKFSEEHHQSLYTYMKHHRLSIDEWYGILDIPYLNAVKKYHQYENLRNFKFEQVLYRTLDSARGNHWRYISRKKRCPQGGVFSYEATCDDSKGEYNFEFILIDKYKNVEQQAVFMELFLGFYNKCICSKDGEKDKQNFDKYLKCELDLLIEGYTHKQVNINTEKVFPYGHSMYKLDRDIKKFRDIFKQIFEF